MNSEANYQDLDKEREILSKHQQTVDRIIRDVENLNQFYTFPATTRSHNLLKIRKEIGIKLEDVYKKRQNLLNNCQEHSWIPDGHDSHKFYYKCTKCGASDWR